MDRTNTAIAKAMTYATVAVSDTEAAALCSDRLTSLIRPLEPQPPDHVTLPIDLTPDPKHSFIFWAPPLRPRSEDKAIPVYSPWGKVSIPESIGPKKEVIPAQIYELRVQEPWWRRNKEARIRNFNGTFEQRKDGVWTTEEGENIAEWEADGWYRSHALLMPHAWSRFRLQLHRVSILRYNSLTWPMIHATGFQTVSMSGRAPTSKKVMSVFAEMWDLEFGKESVIGPNRRSAHPTSANPFVWVLDVWPSHLPRPRLERPPAPPPTPKVPGTFTATDHMRKQGAQRNDTRDALLRGK